MTELLPLKVPIHLKVYGFTSILFHYFYKTVQFLELPVCFSGQLNPFKRANSIFKKLIPIKKGSKPHQEGRQNEIAELLLLKVYPFILIITDYTPTTHFLRLPESWHILTQCAYIANCKIWLIYCMTNHCMH